MFRLPVINVSFPLLGLLESIRQLIVCRHRSVFVTSWLSVIKCLGEQIDTINICCLSCSLIVCLFSLAYICSDKLTFLLIILTFKSPGNLLSPVYHKTMKKNRTVTKKHKVKSQLIHLICELHFLQCFIYIFRHWITECTLE